MFTGDREEKLEASRFLFVLLLPFERLPRRIVTFDGLVMLLVLFTSKVFILELSPDIFSFQCRDVHFIDYSSAHWFDKSGQRPILNNKVWIYQFVVNR